MSITTSLIPENNQNTLYIVGSRMLEDQLMQLAKAIDAELEGKFGIVYIDVDGADGATLAERYDLASSGLPAVLLVEEDEEIYASWYGADLPNPQTVAEEIQQLTGFAE